MNFRFVANQSGLLLLVLSAILMGVGLWEAADYYFLMKGEKPALTALLLSAGLGGLAGGALWWLGWDSRNHNFSRRDAIFLVSVSWLLAAALSAMPFLFWAQMDPDVSKSHPFQNYVDCYFEAMSGLTTTGASVLNISPNDIESLPRGLLLWRSLLHWLGGVGIVVLFVAVLPSVGVGGKKIFHAEASGPTQAGVRPRIAETARILWLIYLGMTALQIVSLRLCGMNWFDSACHTFGSVGTGGFSTRNASIGAYHSTAINIVTVIFMILAGANFGLYYQVLRGSFKNFRSDPELRVYLAIFGIGSGVIVFSLLMAGQPLVMTDGSSIPPTIGATVEHGVFSTASILTTTGYGTSDYHQWPFLAKSVLVVLMFIGGCAGSTGGGIKVVRVWIVLKLIIAELEKAFRPNVIRPTRLGKSSIDADLKLAVLVYTLGIILLAAIGSVLVFIFEAGRCNYTTAATSSIACLFSIGPGLGEVGPVENYGWMSSPSKILLSLWMLLGRLEVFPLAVLVMPRFWKSD